MRQSLLHISFKNFITKCSRLLQNAPLLHNESKMYYILYNGVLLHNVALQGLLSCITADVMVWEIQ